MPDRVAGCSTVPGVRRALAGKVNRVPDLAIFARLLRRGTSTGEELEIVHTQACPGEIVPNFPILARVRDTVVVVPDGC